MKVKAKNEDIAKVLKHPTGAIFGADLTSYWPPGQFTTRRLRDGDITVVEEEINPPPETFSRRGAAGKPAPKPAAKPAPAPRSETT
jgi:hypothetical protein